MAPEQIVKTLREYRPYADDYAREHHCASAVCLSAAATIESLAAALAAKDADLRECVGLLRRYRPYMKPIDQNEIDAFLARLRTEEPKHDD